MIDVKLPVRKAFYDLLMGQLTYAGNLVPVNDDLKALGDSSNPYVLLSNQTGTPVNSFQTFDSNETIVLQIVNKAASRTNKAVVDNVAAQIIPLVVPAPGSNGLVPSPAIQINCVGLSGDTYMTLTLNNSNTFIKRLLTFKMRVRQTGTSAPTPPIPGFQNPVTSANFDGNPTQYANGGLNGRTFLLYLNGVGFLTLGMQWSYLSGGGFQILMNNFDATKNSYTFYLLLQ